MKRLRSASVLLTLCWFLVGAAGCGDDNSDGGCPGSIISSCTETCPENCADKGKQEVCVGAGYEPNRCCYCE
jgi:hypothetical protein